MFSNLTFTKNETCFDLKIPLNIQFIVNLDNKDEYHFIEFKTIMAFI